MSRATVKSLERAAVKAAGLRRGYAEAGYRADRRGGEVTSNELHWHDDDAPHGDLFDVCALTPDDLKGPRVLDLYVYEGSHETCDGDLITNVCAVIDARGELLACFDSVSTSGMQWLAWWREGTACRCEKCRTYQEN